MHATSIRFSTTLGLLLFGAACDINVSLPDDVDVNLEGTGTEEDGDGESALPDTASSTSGGDGGVVESTSGVPATTVDVVGSTGPFDDGPGPGSTSGPIDPGPHSTSGPFDDGPGSTSGPIDPGPHSTSGPIDPGPHSTSGPSDPGAHPTSGPFDRGGEATDGH